MFERRRWVAVIVAALVVGLIELISDGLLDAALPFPWDILIVIGVVCVLTFVFATVALRRIDGLARDLARRNSELEARAASAATLHRVSAASAAIHDLDEVLALVVDSARQLLGADVAILSLARPDGSVVLRASSGRPDALEPGASGRVAETDDIAAFIRPAARVAHLAALLRRGSATVGSLAVGSGLARTYGIGDVETLGSLASQASLAIENATLQARLRELAVVEERERIAREMHDGLAQVLGYVNMKSQAADELLAAGRTADARTQLGELAAAARSVYVDVREAILGLRSPIRDGEDLVPALEAYAARFADAAKIAVTVEADPSSRGIVLAPAVQANVFRIVQESLTNVRKHAGAGRVLVDVHRDDESLVARIADDGRGMSNGGEPRDGSGDPWPRFGIAAMQERANAIGATITWHERAGGGTEVVVSVPLATAIGHAAVRA